MKEEKEATNDGYRLWLDNGGNPKILNLFTWEVGDYADRWLTDEWYSSQQEAIEQLDKFMTGHTETTWWRLVKVLNAK